jgi:RPA family protein
MYQLIIRGEPHFEADSVEKVKKDYFDYYVMENDYPVIDRIEILDENHNLVKIILGNLFYDDLTEEMLDWKKQAEIESQGYIKAQQI